MQIINRPTAGSRIGSSLEQGLSTGIQGGLQSLLQQKMQQFQQQQKIAEQERLAQYWQEAIPGLPSGLSMLLSDPKIGKSVLDRLEGLQVGGAPSQSVQPVDDIITPEPQEFQPEPSGLKIGASPAERRHRENIQARKDVAEYKTKQQQEMAYDKELKEAIDQKRRSSQRLDNLGQMREYNQGGKLDNALFVQILDRMGIKGLLSPESQAYQSLQQEFLRDLKPLFGGRIAVQEMEQFLKSLPTLYNTPEGRELIINNLEKFYKAQQLQSQVFMDTLKKNPNMKPLDLRFKVEEKLEKKLQKIGASLDKGLKQVNTLLGSPSDKKPLEIGQQIPLSAAQDNNIVEDDDGKLYRVKGGQLVPYEGAL